MGTAEMIDPQETNGRLLKGFHDLAMKDVREHATTYEQILIALIGMATSMAHHAGESQTAIILMRKGADKLENNDFEEPPKRPRERAGTIDSLDEERMMQLVPNLVAYAHDYIDHGNITYSEMAFALVAAGCAMARERDIGWQLKFAKFMTETAKHMKKQSRM
jgi:hypothetical protein